MNYLTMSKELFKQIMGQVKNQNDQSRNVRKVDIIKNLQNITYLVVTQLKIYCLKTDLLQTSAEPGTSV